MDGSLSVLLAGAHRVVLYRVSLASQMTSHSRCDVAVEYSAVGCFLSFVDTCEGGGGSCDAHYRLNCGCLMYK